MDILFSADSQTLLLISIILHFVRVINNFFFQFSNGNYLFNTLDADNNGIDLQELEDYVSTYELVANLNVALAASAVVR